MSSAREVPAFRTDLNVSKYFVLLLSAGHVGALVIGAILSASTPWLAPLCLAVVLSWLWTVERRALLRSSRAFVAIELTGERFCALRMRDGVWIQGQLRDSSHVLPWLIVLDVAVEGRLFGARVALFADSMPRDAHRRLRVRLRWARYDEAGVDRRDAPL